MSDLVGRRLTLAALKLHEAGHHPAVTELTAGLSQEELEQAFLSQTVNASLVLASAFGEELWEDRLPEIAALGGRTRSETVSDYLSVKITRLAREEWA